MTHAHNKSAPPKAKKMAAVFLRDHPELRPFVLPTVRLTGRRIGAGAYGSVEEVEIPGAKCAAKKIHDIFQDRSEIPEAEIRKASRQFVVECQLMSSLRHPHIVQFLGVCFLPGSRLPALVMERLLTSLHELLDPETEPETPDTKPYIPLGLKCSILHNVAQGLSFLHSHAPPIIHRDLSARNVLLDSAMVAKIADLGVARIVPSLRAATMTKAPGASIYMPPEALEDESRYDMTIDIFSFGVLAIFILSQTFPKPLSAAYMDARRMMVGRTELERRANYMQQIHSQLRNGHPLIVMIQRCLKNLPQDRPAVHQVVELLDQAKTEVQDVESDMNKLELVQSLREKTQRIRSNEEEGRSMAQQIQQLQSSLDMRMERIHSLQEEIQSQREEVQSQQTTIQSQQVEIVQLKQQLQVEKPAQRSLSSAESAVTDTVVEKPVQKSQSSADSAVHDTAVEKPGQKSQSSADSAVHGTAVQPLKWPLPLKWRRGKDAPLGVCHYHVVILNGMVYVGGGWWKSEYHVLQYNLRSGEWSELPRSPVSGFAMASLNGQLVLVGNHCDADDDRITVWDSTSGGWGHPYPAMPTGRSCSAAVGYQNYLIVACGFGDKIYRMDTVEVLDSSSGRWYSAQSVPMGGHGMSSAVVGDHWYLSSYTWKDDQPHIFSTHLPTLISSATSAAQTNTTSIWQELPTPPVHGPTLLALQSHLLLVGGRGPSQKLHRYDPQAKEWRECGQLPVGRAGSSCTVLSSGELMVVGGSENVLGSEYFKQMWIGEFDT